MASDYSLTNLRNKLKDIARPYLFKVEFSGGCFEGINDSDVIVKCRSANFPGLVITDTNINLSGFNYKVAGVPNYNPFSCQFIIDDKYKIAKDIYKSLAKIHEFTDGPKFHPPSKYMGEVTLKGLDNNKADAFTYNLGMAFITQIGDIGYNHETVNSPLTFDMTISYSYFTTDADWGEVPSGTGGASDVAGGADNWGPSFLNDPDA